MKRIVEHFEGAAQGSSLVELNRHVDVALRSSKETVQVKAIGGL